MGDGEQGHDYDPLSAAREVKRAEVEPSKPAELAPDPKYVKAWRKAEPRKLHASVLALSSLSILGLLFAARSGVWAIVVTVITLATMAVTLAARRDFRCPRCGKPFGDVQRFPSYVRPPTCQDCRLPYGAPRDPDGDE